MTDRRDAYARLHRWRQAIQLQHRGELREKPVRTPWGKITVKETR